MEVEPLKQTEVDIFSFTDRGKRSKNEDRFFYKEIYPGGHLMLVADGMGGYDHGDLAAEIAIKAVVDYIQNDLSLPLIEKIEISFLKAHNTIKQELENAGTTLGGVLITGPEIYVFWAGDVKIILCNGKDYFISKEHNLLNLLRDSEITIKADEVNRLTNTVVRSLGGNSNSYSPEIIKLKRQESLSGIVCTDGLVRLHTNDELVGMILTENGNPSGNSLNSELYKNADDNVTGLLFFMNK